jgi:NAD(P)-dependent dehydrogenase (short-subunit alcohol dehydrogenase family)
VLADIDADGLEDLDRSVGVAGDLTDPAVVDRVVHTAVASFGGLDAVVLNAGIAATGRLEELADSVWERSLDVNLTSHFQLTRRATRLLREQGIGGSLVYVASKNAFQPGPGFGPYSVAKAGLVQLMRIAALEGGKDGIRANAVNPDAIFTGSKLWSEELRRERAEAYGIPVEDVEAFYASEPARPRGYRRRCRRGGRFRLRPVEGDDGRRDPGRQRLRPPPRWATRMPSSVQHWPWPRARGRPASDPGRDRRVAVRRVRIRPRRAARARVGEQRPSARHLRGCSTSSVHVREFGQPSDAARHRPSRDHRRASRSRDDVTPFPSRGRRAVVLGTCTSRSGASSGVRGAAMAAHRSGRCTAPAP